jgi:uncharacterized protein YutE (UPF0331/DUF86 family)
VTCQDEYLAPVFLVASDLEIAAQRCIDICHRIISLEGARKPVDYYDAILRMGELGVLPPEFARLLAPVAGFRTILVHEYLAEEWDQVFRALHGLEDLVRFWELVRRWYRQRRVDLV